MISIGVNAFADCISLASITLPEGVTKIGAYTFNNCSSLTSVTIPEGVTSIGELAFNDCTNLASITSHAVMPPCCGDDTFEGVDKSIPVYVPVSSVVDYQVAEEWKEFTNVIGMETNIEKTTDNDRQAIVIYDLTGRRVLDTENLKGGIYIINGRKVLIDD